MPRRISLCLAIVLAATPALSSSPDAWQEFAEDVKQKCLEATKDTIVEAGVAVDPFGSESFGLAIVSGFAKGVDEKIPVSRICVYDKQTQAVEAGSELDQDKLKVEIPAAAQ